MLMIHGYVVDVCMCVIYAICLCMCMHASGKGNWPTLSYGHCDGQ